MDEKDSVRPDDSASVQAIDEEESLSGLASGVIFKRILALEQAIVLATSERAWAITVFLQGEANI
jgi:hypothetical protein